MLAAFEEVADEIERLLIGPARIKDPGLFDRERRQLVMLVPRLRPIGDEALKPSDRRKLAVLCWHVLTKEQDYLWARPALVANKMRALQLQAGLPQKKGNQRGPAYAYNVEAQRDRELTLAQQAERNYARFADRWRARPPKGEARVNLNPARNE